MDKDLMDFQPCFANNTGMQFPLSDVSFLLFLFSNHCFYLATCIFWSSPKMRLPIDSSCSSWWAAPASIRRQLTLDSLLTLHFLTPAYRCLHPSDGFGSLQQLHGCFHICACCKSTPTALKAEGGKYYTHTYI